MLPIKCVLRRMDMVSGQLETVGRNWTLRASLQRGIIKAIVRFHKSPLHREDTSLNSKLKLLLPSGHEPTPRKKSQAHLGPICIIKLVLFYRLLLANASNIPVRGLYPVLFRCSYPQQLEALTRNSEAKMQDLLLKALAHGKDFIKLKKTRGISMLSIQWQCYI